MFYYSYWLEPVICVLINIIKADHIQMDYTTELDL